MAALARAALAGDEAALARLRATEGVGAALRGADERELRARLQTLQAVAGGPAGRAAGDRRAGALARAVLDDRRFRRERATVPGRSFFARIGDAVRSAARGVLDAVDGALPGGRSVAWVVIAAVVLLASVLATRRLVDRRAGALAAAHRAARREQERLDPRALERAATERERAGDLDAALRLRFRAGLARLGEQRPDLRVGRPSGELARVLRSDEFAHLARDFDAVAYGGMPARREQVAAARETWPRLLERTGAER